MKPRNKRQPLITDFLLQTTPKLSTTLKYKTSTPTILANMGCGCIMRIVARLQELILKNNTEK